MVKATWPSTSAAPFLTNISTIDKQKERHGQTLATCAPTIPTAVSGLRCYSAPVSGTIPAAKKKYVPTDGKYPKGFKVSGTIVGVKPNNTTKPDLAFITSDTPCAAAAVFTKNKFQAAPVTFSRALLQKSKNAGLRGVLINSGCANAVTGKGGLEDAEAMAKEADKSLGASDATIVMSTGVIGQRLPIQKILNNVPTAHNGLGDSHKHWMSCATAICTTDTFPKLISKSFTLPSSPSVEYRIAGMTKGAGMIHPNMATLLGVMATDAPVAPSIMPALLKRAVDKSFNSITIDGDTSTNDTVALLANGAAGGKEISSESSADFQAFQEIVSDFSTELAKLIVRDGEGATKFVTIRVVDSASEEVARTIASTIARSPLVKTALYGKDANWGRILCATGYSLISEPGQAVNEVESIVPEKTNVSFIPADGSKELKLLIDGEPEMVDEARAAEILEHEDLEILVRLGTGNKEATYWTCDYSHEYMVEKYRPIFLDDVVGNTETIERLKIIAKDGNMPHVIISGMPGIGKTTSVLCLARQLLGDAYKEAVLELNASDERGIDVVRNRIKGFAQKKVTLPAGRHKLVILDEADSMTSGAQQALRRTMEIYSNTTRFAFACNQSNKIIEPLQSRCAILRYARLTDAQVVKRLMQIIEAEKVQYSDDGLAALVFSAEGDMRQAINNLQSTFAGFGFVSGDNVFKVVDSPHPIKVQAMLKACYEGNVESALDTLRELWDLGYSSHDIISTMFRVTKTMPTLSEHSKLEFIKEIGFTHMKILEGVQTLLQLSGCVARLCKLNIDPKKFETKV
ncbi:DNA replication factor C-like protein [Microdochium trichocladiopsis]|uniref:Arginine biosynthesis bifunctional protein ArgJ, mitochondrial n=1 Tax=Microdochium trichocladiopsis TaxID=1682393 RepID=A0A9P8Y7B0_9PEZI|nr:DNA replication factor C-like protein [Microdochium trichocladiopsis]KAH7033495.1 DNA replication factor C-like protein [Microdochium trichocladiopsis]